MSNARIIAVVGATGAQGGGLVRAIHADPSSGFRARAITRKANGDKAAELRKLGAEVVEADLDNEASLAKAFEGAYGAYCVTNYWEHMTPAKEVSQARNMAQAAKAAKRRARDLVDARRHAQARAALGSAHADAHGEIQGAAFRREGRRGRAVRRGRRADDVSAHVLLLGELHLLRHGTEEGPGRQVRHHDPDGQRAVVRHRGRRHRQMRATGSSGRARSGSASAWVSQAST